MTYALNLAIFGKWTLTDKYINMTHNQTKEYIDTLSEVEILALIDMSIDSIDARYGTYGVTAITSAIRSLINAINYLLN